MTDILVLCGLHDSGAAAIEPWKSLLSRGPGALAALRAPHLLPSALFEPHWTWWVAGAAVGAVLLFVGLRRPEIRLYRAGQALLVVTLVWVAAAFSFDTPAERLYNAHKTLAAAAERQDVDTIVSYLDNDFVADGGELGVVSMNHDKARQAMGEVLREYTPREIHITAYRAEPPVEGGSVTHIVVIANITNVGPTKSYWRITWADEPGADWRIMRLAAEAPPPDAGH